MNTNELRTLLNSSRINFLIGSGASKEFLPTLNSVENDINTAEEDGDDTALIAAYRTYFEGVMIPNKRLLNNELNKSETTKAQATLQSYEDFFRAVSQILLTRGSNILGKQANIFTTNIDVLMELTLEKLGIDYCDGFTGNIRPTFNASNFKRSVMQRTLQFENVTEIPLFNVLKLHGSLTWCENENNEIIFKNCGQLFDAPKNDKEFRLLYDELQIVNPGASKYSDTVLTQTYFDLLRAFSSELEKENAVLFIVGFSLKDQHIRQIILRAADSNPTLKIVHFCHSADSPSRVTLLLKPDERRYKNIDLVVPGGDIENFNLQEVSAYLNSAINGANQEIEIDI